MIMSPINLVSALSMLLLGSRNTTADALSQLLRAEEFMAFNPHLILKNITDSLIDMNAQKHIVGIANNIFIAKVSYN